MNYKKHYDKLIERANNRIISGYTEKHHIIPRCMGGNDDIGNLVELTPEEHFVAHQLLVKMYPGNYKLVSAVIVMCGRKKGRVGGNKLYGWLKRKNANEREPHSFEVRQKISMAHKGKKHSDETKDKMSKNRKGKTGPKMPETTRKALIQANTGRPPANKGIPMSDEIKNKIITTMAPIYESRRGIPMQTVICPHCNKEGNRIVMHRWHFDNCKLVIHTH